MASARRLAHRALGAFGRRYRALRHRWEPRLRPSSFRDWSDLKIKDFSRIAISMDPAMYREGRLYETDDYELRPLADAEKRLVYPSYRYRRPDPRTVNAEAFQDRLSEVFDAGHRLPGGVEVREATLAQALIFGDTVYLRQGDELVALYESCRENDRTVLRIITPEDMRRVRPMSGLEDAVFLSSPGSANFGHWLTDDLTRVVVSESGRVTTWLMTDHGELMNARRRESLRLALGDPSAPVRFIASNEAVLVENLRYASRATYHPLLKSPQAIAATRERVTAKMSEGTPSDERLYIARRRSAREPGVFYPKRGLINDEEILQILTARGFRVLDPLAASAEEQAKACFRAQTIVGVMGASMTNTMFARPGTNVVYLAANGWTEPFFWDLAAVCGHEYTSVFGPTEGEGSPWELPFRIDAPSLVSTLDEIDAH